MMPMKLNMSKVTKIAGDKHSSTFQHQDGHQIKILHKALPALQRKQLEKMPIKMADGGDPGISGDTITGNTGAPTLPDSSQLPPLAGPNNMSLSPGVGANILPPQPESEAPDAGPTDSRAPAQQSQSQPAGNGQVSDMAKQANNYSADVGQAYNQGQRGISEQAKVEADKAQAQQQVIQKDLEARQDLQKGFAQNLADFQASQKTFLNDYANGQIDPNHYMESRSTGQKIANGIGLFLGGLGQGLIGGNNPAQDWLNNQIDRDISAQKANLDKKKTLLGANQEMFKDSVLANNATRVNMNDIYDHQIQNEAAKLGTAQAKAAADMAHSKFALENAQLLNQSSMRATALHAAASGGAGLADPSVLVPALVPPEHQKQVFSEIEAAQNVNNNRAAILKAYDDSAKFHAVDLVPGMMNKDLKALHVLLGPTFKDVEGTVRQAAMDNLFKNIDTGLVSRATPDAISTGRSALEGYLNSKASAPTAKAFNIDLTQYPSTSHPTTTPSAREGQTGIDAQGHRVQIQNGKPVRIK